MEQAQVLRLGGAPAALHRAQPESHCARALATAAVPGLLLLSGGIFRCRARLEAGAAAAVLENATCPARRRTHCAVCPRARARCLRHTVHRLSSVRCARPDTACGAHMVQGRRVGGLLLPRRMPPRLCDVRPCRATIVAGLSESLSSLRRGIENRCRVVRLSRPQTSPRPAARRPARVSSSRRPRARRRGGRGGRGTECDTEQ